MTTTHESVTLPRALRRGFSMRCPNCGQASLFGRFLNELDPKGTQIEQRNALRGEIGEKIDQSVDFDTPT